MLRILLSTAACVALILCVACGPSNTPASKTKTDVPTATEQAVTESSQIGRAHV